MSSANGVWSMRATGLRMLKTAGDCLMTPETTTPAEAGVLLAMSWIRFYIYFCFQAPPR